jgi:hypothetical protein
LRVPRFAQLFQKVSRSKRKALQFLDRRAVQKWYRISKNS